MLIKYLWASVLSKYLPLATSPPAKPVLLSYVNFANSLTGFRRLASYCLWRVPSLKRKIVNYWVQTQMSWKLGDIECLQQLVVTVKQATVRIAIFTQSPSSPINNDELSSHPDPLHFNMLRQSAPPDSAGSSITRLGPVYPRYWHWFPRSLFLSRVRQIICGENSKFPFHINHNASNAGFLLLRMNKNF